MRIRLVNQPHKGTCQTALAMAEFWSRGPSLARRPGVGLPQRRLRLGGCLETHRGSASVSVEDGTRHSSIKPRAGNAKICVYEISANGSGTSNAPSNEVKERDTMT